GIALEPIDGFLDLLRRVVARHQQREWRRILRRERQVQPGVALVREDAGRTAVDPELLLQLAQRGRALRPAREGPEGCLVQHAIVSPGALDVVAGLDS